MECRQSWRALASTRKLSRLDNGFPGVRYRRRSPRGWIPTRGWDFDHAGGFEEPLNSPFADRFGRERAALSVTDGCRYGLTRPVPRYWSILLTSEKLNSAFGTFKLHSMLPLRE